jgi:scyllo-inositol 2-dehydrogenase (NAD+)
MGQISVAIVGAGWIGEMRAITCARHPLVRDILLAETDAARAERVSEQSGARRWTADHRELLDQDVDAVIISATPETTHYPMAREWLRAGKHVLLEKPMALTLAEADELIELARKAGVKFTIGYTQRFNPKLAYAKQCVVDGTLGRPVSALVSRHLTRSLGAKIAGRGDLGPVQMEGTHDIDLCLWWMDPARPKRVYAQAVEGVMREKYGLPDCVWTLVTMDNGAAFTIGSNWNLPLENPGFAGTSVELVCTEGALFVDESRRDVLLTTTQKGISRPLSTMPGEPVGHVFAGPLEVETRAFVDCVARDEPVLVTPDEARRVMEVTLAADLSAERGQPVELPLPRD